MADQIEKLRAWILVKAYPQPSEKYQETVCVAAISEDGKRLLRLYPVRFRHLEKDHRFTRFDLIEADGWQDTRDGRPESYRLQEQTLRLANGPKLDRIAKARLWKPFVYSSLSALKQARETQGTSLGIIKPDPESVQFVIKPIKNASPDDREHSESMTRQVALLEERLNPLPSPRYAFYYKFVSDGAKSNMMIHDWEVQTTFHNYVRSYASEEEALEKMRQAYGDNFPKQELHLVMGTMKRHPHQFIIIGVLRPGLDMTLVDSQTDLFA